MARTDYRPEVCDHGLRDTCLMCFTEEMDQLRAENRQQWHMIAALVEQLGGEAIVGRRTLEYIGKFHTLTTEDTAEGNLRVRLTDATPA